MSKLHKMKEYYDQFDKGQLTGPQFKQVLQEDLKIRWNPKLETLTNRIEPSYTQLLKSVNLTNKYVPKQQKIEQENLPIPKKIRKEHEGNANLLKWD